MGSLQKGTDTIQRPQKLYSGRWTDYRGNKHTPDGKDTIQASVGGKTLYRGTRGQFTGGETQDRWDN